MTKIVVLWLKAATVHQHHERNKRQVSIAEYGRSNRRKTPEHQHHQVAKEIAKGSVEAKRIHKKCCLYISEHEPSSAMPS